MGDARSSGNTESWNSKILNPLNLAKLGPIGPSYSAVLSLYVETGSCAEKESHMSRKVLQCNYIYNDDKDNISNLHFRALMQRTSLDIK